MRPTTTSVGSQVLQSKCLCIISGTSWYVNNSLLLKDPEVPYLAEHIRNLVKSFDLKILDSEKLLLWQLGRYLSYPRNEYSLINRSEFEPQTFGRGYMTKTKAFCVIK